MSILQIRLLGKFSICIDKQFINPFHSEKAQELLWYLLVYKDRPHSREHLADLLLESSDQTYTKQYFRKTLWYLQSALKEINSKSSLLDIDSDWIQINPRAIFWLDTAIYEDTFDSIKNVLSKDINERQYHRLTTVVPLYKGDLLEGCYRDWCLYERERFREIHIDFLDKLMEYCEAHDNFAGGIQYGRELLRFDRARERTHFRLMQIYDHSGDRIAALRQYECCKKALKEELNVAPSEQTANLYRRIFKGNQHQVTQFDKSKTGAEESPPDVVRESLKHLKQLARLQDRISRQIPIELETLERSLEVQDKPEA